MDEEETLERGKEAPGFDVDPDFCFYELADDTDAQIILHRDSHFGGDFDRMIAYYADEGKGVQETFSLQRLFHLREFEATETASIAELLLTEYDAEVVATSIDLREQLHELAENEDEPPRRETLIARLILSEEDPPEEIIEEIAAHGEAVVPLLIELLKSERLRQPLFPGYGLAPDDAARCLGQIGSASAVQALFEEIGDGDFEREEALLSALRMIGRPAVEFLLDLLSSTNHTRDVERAAMALGSFDLETFPEISSQALHLLEHDFEIDSLLGNQLLYLCEGLREQEEWQRFAALVRTHSHKLDAADRTLAERWISSL